MPDDHEPEIGGLFKDKIQEVGWTSVMWIGMMERPKLITSTPGFGRCYNTVQQQSLQIYNCKRNNVTRPLEWGRLPSGECSCSRTSSNLFQNNVLELLQ